MSDVVDAKKDGATQAVLLNVSSEENKDCWHLTLQDNEDNVYFGCYIRYDNIDEVLSEVEREFGNISFQRKNTKCPCVKRAKSLKPIV